MFLKQNKFFIFLFIILAIIPILSLFHAGFPITHDGQDHVARIANFYQNLVEGVLIPRWAANLNWGYGHPILEFLYPLPSYIASIFHFVGFSFVDSTKLVFITGEILSLLFMYLFLSKFLDKYSSLFGAMLYSFAPYRMIDLYVRGDIGEHLAFAFIPLSLYFIYKVSTEKDYRNVIFGGVSIAFLILAHNAISLMAMPFVLFYSAFLIYLNKDKKALVIKFFLLILLGFSLSTFFWIPALMEGKYTLRNLLTTGFGNNFTNLAALFYGPWNYGISGQFTVQLGVLQWIVFFLSFPMAFLLFKKKKKEYIFISGLIIYTLTAIFLMLPVSSFVWSKIMLLQNFQFPWRFLAITVFSTAVLGGFLFSYIPKRYQVIAFVLCAVLILFVEKDYFKPKAYQYKPETFYSGIYNSTTDTGESSPVWSVRFMEKRPAAHMLVIDGSAKIKESKRTSVMHEYSISVYKKTLFQENTLYFPGWEITANGLPLSIQFQNKDYRGTMLFSLDKGNYFVEAAYQETKLRFLSDLISFVSMVCIVFLAGFKLVKAKAS